MVGRIGAMRGELDLGGHVLFAFRIGGVVGGKLEMQATHPLRVSS